MNKKLFFIFRLAVSCGLIFALIKLVPYKDLVGIYRQSHKGYLLLGMSSLFAGIFLLVIRWRFLLSALGVKVPLREIFLSFFSGLFFNLFFPSFVAGDVFRSFGITRRHGQLKKVASSVLMDRFSGLAAVTVIGLAAFIIGYDLLPQYQVFSSLGLLCLGLSFILSAIFSKRFFLFLLRVLKKNSGLRTKLLNFHEQLFFFRKNPRYFLGAILLSLPPQILTVASFFIVSKALGLEVKFIYFMILVPIIMVIAFIPVTIAGIGTREAAAVYFFSLAGIEKSAGLGISLVNLVFLILMGIIGGILYVGVYHRWLQPRS